MYIDQDQYSLIIEQAKSHNAVLVAVSKTKPVEAIEALYHLGQRDFGENYVQELVDKQASLPADIRWHFIGHLQSNKVKYIAPFVHLIHGIDSLRLLKEVDKQGKKANRIIDVLLQVHIAREETKFGFDPEELTQPDFAGQIENLHNVRVVGLMGMASFSEDTNLVRSEFRQLKHLFDTLRQQETPNFLMKNLSMGMSGDFMIALEEGSTLIRIGSSIFGRR